MPQFNFATYSSQIFWLLICFGVFFTYIKFYFLPRLEGVLLKRNEDMAAMKKEIEKNNALAEENIKNAEANINKSQKLADSIISEAEAQARIHEAEVIANAKQIQQNAIEEIIAKQRDVLVGEVFENAVKDSAKIVLQNIGMHVNESEIAEIIEKNKAK